MYTNKKDARFYAFERVALATVLGADQGDYLGVEQSMLMMDRISASYKMKAPTYKKARSDSGYCYYRPVTHSIHINELWGLTSRTILHEMAHAVHRHLRTGGESHGPEFIRVWMDMASRMYHVDVADLEALADGRGVPYTPRSLSMV